MRLSARRRKQRKAIQTALDQGVVVAAVLDVTPPELSHLRDREAACAWWLGKSNPNGNEN